MILEFGRLWRNPSPSSKAVHEQIGSEYGRYDDIDQIEYLDLTPVADFQPFGFRLSLAL